MSSTELQRKDTKTGSVGTEVSSNMKIKYIIRKNKQGYELEISIDKNIVFRYMKFGSIYEAKDFCFGYGYGVHDAGRCMIYKVKNLFNLD